MVIVSAGKITEHLAEILIISNVNWVVTILFENSMFLFAIKTAEWFKFCLLVIDGIIQSSLH